MVALEALNNAGSFDGAILSARAYGGSANHFSSGIDGVAFELVDTTSMTGASALVRIVADALELCYTKPGIGTFLLVAGDDALAPLAVKLRELGRKVIAVTPRGAGQSLAAASDQSATLGSESGSSKSGGSKSGSAKSAGPESTSTQRGRERSGRERNRRPESAARALKRKTARERATKAGKSKDERRTESARPRSSERRPARETRETRSDEAGRSRSSRPAARPTRTSEKEAPSSPRSLEESMKIVREAVDHLARRFGDSIWPSTLSEVLRDRHGLSEKDLGFSNFEDFLEEAEKQDALVLQRNPRSGKLTIYSLEEDD